VITQLDDARAGKDASRAKMPRAYAAAARAQRASSQRRSMQHARALLMPDLLELTAELTLIFDVEMPFFDAAMPS